MPWDVLQPNQTLNKDRHKLGDSEKFPLSIICEKWKEGAHNDD